MTKEPTLKVRESRTNLFAGNRLAKNTFYNTLGFIAPILLFLAFTPVLVRRMGTETYGLWTLALSALGLMGVFEFGVGTAITKYVAEYHASHDVDGLSAIAATGLLLYLVVGVVLTVPLYALAPLAARLFPSSIVSLDEKQHIFRLVSLGVIPMLLKSGGLAVPMGLQRFEIPVVATTVQNALVLVTALFVVSLGGSIELVVFGTVLLLWLVAVGSLLVAFRMLRVLGARILFSRMHLHKVLSFATFAGAAGVGGQAFASLDRFAVGAVLGISAVTYYTVAIGIANRLLYLSDLLSRALMPAASSSYATNDVDKVRQYLRRFTIIVALVSFGLAGVMLLFSGFLLRVWMGPAFADRALSATRILIFIYAVISVNAPAYHIANGIGVPWICALGAIGGGVATVGLILTLGRLLGLDGAAWGNAGYWLSLTIVLYMAAKLRIDKRGLRPVMGADHE